jgi:hypothetical protein
MWQNDIMNTAFQVRWSPLFEGFSVESLWALLLC